MRVRSLRGNRPADTHYHCATRGIEFLSTPFDEQSIDVLVDLGVRRLKIPSGEITNGPLLLKAARTGLPIILSTGMSDLEDVSGALAVIGFGYAEANAIPSMPAFQKNFERPDTREILRQRVTLLHCTTEYPAPLIDVNLRAMDTLADSFDIPIGYSDHTRGITVPIAAVARGAGIIEKHLTLDRGLEGPDHKASVEPPEMAAMVTAIREVEQALGGPDKAPAPSELGNRTVIRKSLVARAAIRRGEILSPDKIIAKRPAGGLANGFLGDCRAVGPARLRGWRSDHLSILHYLTGLRLSVPGRSAQRDYAAIHRRPRVGRA